MPPKQYSKFKPWRKGKSEKHSGPSGGKKMSVKNRLRGQKRLLAKLEEKGDLEGADGIKQRIKDLEAEVKVNEAKEREKKNSTKYHQVKFIERQKLTRLEKSIQRQLKQLKEQSATERTRKQISLLQSQLNSVVRDQLYVAFYPPDVKYISLFTNGMDRAVDDERGAKRRRDVWEKIRDGLLADLKDGGGGKDEERKVQFASAKSWINLEVARKALLSMPLDTYPNDSSQLGDDAHMVGQKQVRAKKPKSTNNAHAEETEISGTTIVSDDRFVFSKEVDGLFHESTTGDDYQEKLEMEEDKNQEGDDDSDASSNTDASSDDDADPLKEFAGTKKHPIDRVDSSSDGKNKAPALKNAIAVNKEHGSSSSSSSSDSSDSSDSECEEAPLDSHSSRIGGNSTGANRNDHANANADDSDDEEVDDFFTTEKVTADQVFAQAEKHQNIGHSNEDHYQLKKRSDKSKGFSTQNQTKREFRNFQQRKKRSKFS